jgi:hypothetical protein
MSMALHSEQIVLVDPSDFITSYDLALADQDRYVRSPSSLWLGLSCYSGQANPMLTIVAMALRLAQHLEIRLGGRFV